MATNQLLPFANGDTPNVLDFSSWNALAARQTGFQSGIASSQQFNYILAQGGAAGYVIGQLVADELALDATFDCTTLYANFKRAIATFVGANLPAGSVTTDMLADGAVTFPKIAPAAIATADQALAGTAKNLLMTPYLTKLMVNAAIPTAVPPGTIIHYAGRTVPSGWLIANGAKVSRKDYAALFAAIGTTYGVGDGSTTFGLPNLDGRFLEGTTSTSSVGTYYSAGLPNITGTILGASNDGDYFTGAFSRTGDGPSKTHGAEAGIERYNSAVDFYASRSSGVYGNSSTVKPPAMTALVLIKF